MSQRSEGDAKGSPDKVEPKKNWEKFDDDLEEIPIKRDANEVSD